MLDVSREPEHTGRGPHRSPDVPENMRRDVVLRVCGAHGMSEKTLFSRNREPRVIQARFTAFLALSLLGASCAAIARMVGMNHSTIVHALEKAEGRAEVAELARSIAIAVERQPNMWIMRHLPENMHVPVFAYLQCLVNGRTQGVSAYAGLTYLACDARARMVAMEYLNACGNGAHSWRIRTHARQLGLQWQETAGAPLGRIGADNTTHPH